MFIPKRAIEEKLLQLLVEDIGQGDITAAAVVPPGLIVKAVFVAKEDGVAAGFEETTIFAEYLGLKAKVMVEDGKKIKKKQVLIEVSGDAQTILSAERAMLNLLSRMSGIATKTKHLTDLLQQKNAKVKIAATRKTLPGLLYFDKKAVMIGGGDSHRLHLDDMILIKDNHIVIAGSVEKAVLKAKTSVSFSKKIEVEVTKSADALKAAVAGADIIMLDNFSVDQIKQAVELLKKKGFFGKVLLEASGGISENNILDYADTEVDILSLGELTHSVKALDISLEIVE